MQLRKAAYMRAKKFLPWTLRHLSKSFCNKASHFRLEQYDRSALCLEFVSLLKDCTNKSSGHGICQIHSQIIKRAIHNHNKLSNTLMDIYIKCNSLEAAQTLFQTLSHRDVCTWTLLITAYARQGHHQQAIGFFRNMTQQIQPNQFALSSILLACANSRNLMHGMEIHGKVVINMGFHLDVILQTALVDMYAKCGRVEYARHVFDKMPSRDPPSCNAMLNGFLLNCKIDDALRLFHRMPQRNVVSWTGIVGGLAQNGLARKAMSMLREMPSRFRGIESWNAVISGLVQSGFYHEGIQLFDKMQRDGVCPNRVTYAAILPSCANLADLDKGMRIHEQICVSGLEFHIPVWNALIDMYAKCGSVEKARQVFDGMPQRTAISWNSLICGYAIHGYAVEALEMFGLMIKGSSERPNHVTFVGVLTACSRTGLVDEGYAHFRSMSKIYGIVPCLQHYRCMVDVLGRAGRLAEAWDLIDHMPLEPDVQLWLCFLGACRLYANVELAELAVKKIIELDPGDVSSFLLLSNVYAAAGKWSEVGALRKVMRDRGLNKKSPGCSWIQIDGHVHSFLVGDADLFPSSY